MIQVIYRGILEKDNQEPFRQKWEQVTLSMQEKAKGSHGMMLLRNKDKPEEFMVVARWDSFDDWRNFWSGNITKSEVFKEMFLSATLISTEIFEEIQDLWQ
jgi:heme-degrading monooxygenase HmoA